MLSMLGSNVLF